MVTSLFRWFIRTKPEPARQASEWFDSYKKSSGFSIELEDKTYYIRPENGLHCGNCQYEKCEYDENDIIESRYCRLFKKNQWVWPRTLIPERLGECVLMEKKTLGYELSQDEYMWLKRLLKNDF